MPPGKMAACRKFPFFFTGRADMIAAMILKLTDSICHTRARPAPAQAGPGIHLSYPRRRVSSLNLTFWVPAFAGMTASVNVIFNSTLHRFLVKNRSV